MLVPRKQGSNNPPESLIRLEGTMLPRTLFLSKISTVDNRTKRSLNSGLGNDLPFSPGKRPFRMLARHFETA